MGMYTELEYIVEIKPEYVNIMTVILSIQYKDGLESFEDLYDGHDFFSDERAEYLFCGYGCKHEFMGNFLVGKADIKNYTDTYDEYFDLLSHISCDIMLFKTRYEEYDDDNDGWVSHI